MEDHAPGAFLLGGTASVLADSNPFTMDKMLADDVLSAVNTCLSAHKTTGQVFVQGIMPMNRGLVNIVTGDSEGQRMKCVAELRSGKLKEQTPVVDSSGPLFISVVDRAHARAVKDWAFVGVGAFEMHANKNALARQQVREHFARENQDFKLDFHQIILKKSVLLFI